MQSVSSHFHHHNNFMQQFVDNTIHPNILVTLSFNVTLACTFSIDVSSFSWTSIILNSVYSIIMIFSNIVHKHVTSSFQNRQFRFCLSIISWRKWSVAACHMFRQNQTQFRWNQTHTVSCTWGVCFSIYSYFMIICIHPFLAEDPLIWYIMPT